LGGVETWVLVDVEKPQKMWGFVFWVQKGKTLKLLS
jgi:hypothetical protein